MPFGVSFEKACQEESPVLTVAGGKCCKRKEESYSFKTVCVSLFYLFIYSFIYIAAQLVSQGRIWHRFLLYCLHCI